MKKKSANSAGPAAHKSDAGARAHGADGPRRARKVKGGWRLPGDPQLYPYNPLVPPDMVDPVPRPPGVTPRSKK